MKAKDYGLTKQDIIEMSDTYMLDIGYRFPIVVEEAKDTIMKDADGEEYLDFFAGIAVNSVGNCNERVVAAIREQAGQVMHTSLYTYSVSQAMLAKLICENTGFDRVFFQNSGTEANEAMIKMARKYGVRVVSILPQRNFYRDCESSVMREECYCYLMRCRRAGAVAVRRWHLCIMA